MSGESGAQSALRENIESKGSHSYYYGHANAATGPQWDGKEEPRLLSKGVEGDEPAPKPVKSLTDYSWADGKNVSIYVDFERMDDVEEGSAAVDVDADTLTFTFSEGGTVHKLVVGPLFGDAESSSVVVKKDMFVLKLKKADADKDWATLKK